MPEKSTIVRSIGIAARGLSALHPELAGRWLNTLFLTTRRAPRPSRERIWAESASNTEAVLRDGTRVPVWSWGHGPTVLLVHGWDGRGTQLASFAEPLVNAGFRVVAYDAPGHGGAPGKRSSLPTLSDAVLDVAEAVGPVHAVVAHSLGTAAVTYALHRGLRVDRAVYVSPPLTPGEYLHRVGAFLGFSPDAGRRAQARMEATFDLRFDAFDGRVLAPERRTPLLLIHDEDDREVPFAEGMDLAALWPGAETRVTQGLGHRRILRDPGVLGHGVSFLSQGRRGQGADAPMAEDVERAS